MTTYSEWLVHRSCTKKLAWAQKREAKRAADDSARTYGEPRDAWRAYRCDHCGLHHIGHVNRDYHYQEVQP